MGAKQTRIDLVGGPFCGAETVVATTAGTLPARFTVEAGVEYLRTTDTTSTTDQHGRKVTTGRRRYEFIVPSALLGLPRPKPAQQCCEFPGRGCPTYGPGANP